MLKILQGVTVSLVTIILGIGIAIIFALPESIDAYVKYVGVACTVLIPEIAAAFLGKPVKELVAGVSAKLAADKEAGK